MIDNSYGKNLNFYNTWLKDSNLASLPDEVEQDAINFATFVYRQEQEAIKKNTKEYEKLITELREQGNNYEETILNWETTIASLRQKLNRESQKHRKYKRLFNWTLLLMFLGISVLIIIFNT
jgi:exopolysaccharide biosynthesis predicted pyruvyltransferase EpsI